MVDASVAAKWFVREALQADALRLLDRATERLAPDWIVLEVAHVAFKKWRDGEIGSEQARGMVRELPRFMTWLYPSIELTDRAVAIAMALRHPVYDCLYIACAQVAGSLVITADRNLCNVVAGTEFASLVRPLEAVEG